MNPHARRKARFFAVQALYQWQHAQTELPALLAQFLEEIDPKKVDVEYFKELIMPIVENHTAVDQEFEPFLDRKFKDLSQLDLAILRIGTYELKHRRDVPYRVILNEGLELAKKFCGPNSHKYINGVLDQVAKQLRASERSSDGSSA